ncbi:hypothetical protein BCR32DRAFT_290074 [Anaeromyces robustus]|uniref:Nucleolar pre-ribosomal-associated protein 1 C-terminal domain-containing protein n=1 Tax=Anaeromyces robustus TaxID=1754192 RepID=A0A1Y1XKQ7_9FUNG|nr:hypothetical protein BCR32DRAFT_290074 [Anaeromyces robustus]|eukprot:ORX86349.1 hypothetical protein BCR32DRAFT_290074 [Anaeromyces robustus]
MESNTEEFKQFNSSYTPFSSVSDLMDTLRSNNLQILQKGIYNFSFALKKIIGKYNSKSIVDVNDEENLFREYIRKSPECEELFNIWKYQQNNQITVLETPILELLTKVIQVTKTLSSSNVFQIQSTLRLLIAIASHSSATTKELQETFDFSLRNLNKLLNIRRKRQLSEKVEKDDVRSLYIKFIMSFIINGDVIIKKNILELKNFLNLIFKDMNKDSYQLVNFVFTNLRKHVIDDEELPRTVKINFFNSFILEEILKIYKSEFKEYINEEDTTKREARTVPDIVHEFLLYICSNPGIGVCFQDAGWYTATAKTSISKNKNIRIYNKILSKFITVIEPTEDLKQQELLLSILTACPELVPLFWQTVGSRISFEPRLSSKWLGNIILAQKIISLPIPKNLINITNLQEPPPINNVISNIFPPPINRVLLSRGLQHSSYLIKYMCLMVLCFSFTKLQNVVEYINNIKYLYEQKYALQVDSNLKISSNDNNDNKNLITSNILVSNLNTSLIVSKWKEYTRLLLNEIKKDIPDIQIMLSLHHQISDNTKSSDNSNNEIESVVGDDIQSKKDLILGLVLSIIKYYHIYMNEALLESRFDFGKLITTNVSLMAPEIQYNLLELIGEISDFKWWNKNEKNKTHLSTLLNLYLNTSFSDIQSLTLNTLVKILSRSPIFKSCTREISIWFDTMKRTFVVPSKYRQLVVDFFDSVICSIVQDPYRTVDIMLEIENQCKKDNKYLEKYNETDILLNQNENDQSKLIYSLIVYPCLKSLMEYEGDNKAIISRYICYVLISICDMTQKVSDYLLTTISKITNEYNISLSSIQELYWKDKWNEIDWISASYQYFLRISSKNDTSMEIDYTIDKRKYKEVQSKFNNLTNKESNLTLQSLVKFLNNISPGQFIFILPELLDKLEEDKFLNRLSEYIRLRFPYCGSFFDYITEDISRNINKNKWSRLLHRIPFRCLFTNFALIRNYSEIKPLCSFVIYSLNKIENKKYLDIYNEISLFLTPNNITKISFDIVNLIFTIYSLLIKGSNRVLDFILANPFIGENFLVNDIISNRILYILEENIKCKKSSKIWINYYVKARNYIVDNISKDIIISHTILTLFHIFKELMNTNDINLILENLFKNINLNDTVSIKLLEIVLTSSSNITANNNSIDTLLIEKLFTLFKSNSSSQLDKIIYKILLNSKDYNFVVHSDDIQDKLILYENIQTLIEKPFIDFILENMNNLRSKILGILIRNDSRVCYWIFSSNYWKNAKLSEENIKIFSSFLLSEDDIKSKYINYIDKKFKLPLLEKLIERISNSDESKSYLTTERKNQIQEEISLLSNIIKLSTFDFKSKEYYNKIFSCIKNQASKLKSMSLYLINVHSLQMDCYKNIITQYLDNSSDTKNIYYGEIITLLLQCILSINKDDEINNNYVLEVTLFQQLNSLIDEIMLREDKNIIINSIIKSIYNINQLILDDYIKHILANKFESYEIMNSLLKLIKMLYIQWNNMSSMLVSPDLILDNILSHEKYIDKVVKGSSDNKLNKDQENFSKSPIPNFENVKEVIIEIIEFLIKNDPMKCCKPSYLPQIMAAYNATLSITDKKIFNILNIFETSAGVSVAEASILWSYPSLDIRERNQERNHLNNGILVVEIMNLIDSNWMGHTIQWYGMNDSTSIELSEQKDQFVSKRLTPLYDQDFFLPLFAQLLNIAGTKFDIHRFIELNCLGLVVMALSSENIERRKVAYFLIDQLYGLLGSSNLREKKQLLLLCDSFKNSIIDRDTPQRIPTIISLFIARSLLIFTKPDHYMYPLVNRFLLQRPWIDLEDIPLLYNLLYSSSDNYKQERIWILKLLSSGFQDKDDFKPYRRRHVSNLLNSLFHSNLSDISIRKYIIEIFLKLSSNSSIIVDLIIQYGLLSWIQSSLTEFNVDPKNELLIGYIRLINSIWRSWKEADSSWYRGEEGMKNWGKVFISIFYQLIQPISNLLKQLKSKEDNKSKINYQWWLNYFYEVINYIHDVLNFSKEKFNISFKLNSYPILKLIITFDLLIKQYHDAYSMNNSNTDHKIINNINKINEMEEDSAEKYYEKLTRETKKLNKYYNITLLHKKITNLDNLYSLKANQFNNYIELLQKLLQIVIIGIDCNDLIYHQRFDIFINWIIHSLIKLNNYRESAYDNNKMELVYTIDNNISDLYEWAEKSKILIQYLKREPDSLSLVIGILNKQLLFSKCVSDKKSNFKIFVKKQSSTLCLLSDILIDHIQNINNKQGVKRNYSGDKIVKNYDKRFYLEFETNKDMHNLLYQINKLAKENYSNLLFDYKEELLKQYNQAIIFQTGFWINVNLRIPVILGVLLNFIRDIQALYFIYYDFEGTPSFINKIIDYYIHISGLMGYMKIYWPLLGFFALTIILIGITALIYSFTKKEKNSIIYKILSLFTIVSSRVLYYYGIFYISKAIYIDDTGKALKLLPEIELFSVMFLPLIGQFLAIFALFIIINVLNNIIFNTPTLYGVKNALNTNYAKLDNYKLIFSIIFIFAHPYEKWFLKTNFYCIFGFSLFNIAYVIFQANYQTYYKSLMNHFDVGIHSLLGGASLLTSIFMILDVKTVGFYISLGVGIACFFGGVFYSRYILNKKVKTIYSNFKLKESINNSQSQFSSGYGKKEGENDESESDEESNSQSEQENQIIDIEPENKRKKQSRKKHRNEDESNSGSGSNSEENSEDDEEGSDEGDNTELFNQIEDIVTKVAKNEKLVIFKRVCDTDLVCKFVRENQTAEAYQLANKIYKEALKEHPNEQLIYMKYAYFLWYTNKKKNSKHFEPVSTLSQSELGKDDNEIDYDEPLHYIQEAIDLKPPFIVRYKIQYVLSLMRENKNKKADLSKKSTYESFLGMERNAIHYHMITLQQLKAFFTRVKTSNNQEVQYCQHYLKKLFDLQKNTEYHYQKLISQFPDSKSSVRLYAMFLSGVKNQTKLAAKHLASIGATLDDNGKPSNNSQKTNKMIEEDEDDSDDSPNAKSSSVVNNSKKLRKRGNSIQSIQKSENQSSVSSDRENRKEIVLRNNMLQTFVKSISKCSLLMNILYALIFVFTGLLCVTCVISVRNVLSTVNNYRKSSKSMYIISEASHNIRLMSISGLAEDEPVFNLYRNNLCNTLIPEIEDKLMPFLQGSFSDEASDTAVIVQTSDTTFTNEHLNAYEVGKRFQTWVINLCDVPYESWKQNADGTSMMNDSKVRFFADNSKENFIKIMKEAYTNDHTDYTSMKEKWNIFIYIEIGVIVLCMIGLYIFAINPLRSKTKVIFMKVIKMLKYIPNGSFDEIISKFDEDIEVISETYDVSNMENNKSYNKTGDDKNELRKKIKRERIKNIIVFGLIIIVSLICCIPYLVDLYLYIINFDLIFYSSQRCSYNYKIHMLSYEVFARDRYSYLPGEAERLLSQNVALYEDIQSNIKEGNYGAKSPHDIPVLNNFLLNGKCYMSNNCTDDEEYYDSKIGYVRDIITLPLNDLIQENIARVYKLLRETDFSYLNSFENLFAGGITKEEATDIIYQINNNDVLKFQNHTMNHIISGLQEFDQLLLDYVESSSTTTFIVMIVLFVVSAIISPYIYFTSLKKMAKVKIIEMEELVNIVFTIPTSTINIVPQYRRFIETSEINDD